MRSCTNILNQVVADTEEIFNKIAEHYPALLEELEKDISETSVSLDKLSRIDVDSHTGLESVPVSRFLQGRLDEIRLSLNELNKFKDRNQKVINNLTLAISDYQHSQAYISEIRDISESLQIVSLNALVNAVKAGKGGEGFSVITDNLKTVTGSTIEKTGNLERRGESVHRQLAGFRESEQIISEHRKELVELLELKMANGIDRFRLESETVNNLLSGLGRESGDVRSSILRMMEELQQQDIIRQTIDQILLSLKELPSEFESFEDGGRKDDSQMDQIAFGERLLDISILMVDEVVAKLDASIGVFTENIRRAKDKLLYIQQEKDRAVNHFLGNIESADLLSGLNLDLRQKSLRLSDGRQELIALISGMLEQVQGISDEINSFEKISGWLQNVAVLSRIELTRSSSLKHMKESVKDMAELVERIQQQIKRGQSETGDFINSTGLIFEEYERQSHEEAAYMKNFTDSFIEGLRDISSINTSFSEVLQKFEFFSDSFKALFEVSETDLQQMKALAGRLSEVSSELKQRRDRLASVVGTELGRRGVSEWNISDQDMNGVIERFTIYSHKRSAGEVTGLMVEESALEAGEVTLF